MSHTKQFAQYFTPNYCEKIFETVVKRYLKHGGGLLYISDGC